MITSRPMRKFSNQEIIGQLNWRYAVKKFDNTKKISKEDWTLLEESLRLAPSSFGLQPWKFYVIESKELRTKLTPHSWNQTQISDCSHLVVFAHLKKVSEDYITKFIQTSASVRGVNPETLEGYKQMMLTSLVKNPLAQESQSHWTARQSYIAMGQLMTVAALVGIDTCPLEGIVSAEYDKLLNLSSGPYQTVAAVACGYRHADDKYQHAKKVRFASEDIFVHI